MERGKLYGVSVGPGDPEMLTLQAARVLGEVDCIAAPDIGGSARTALRIVERYIEGKDIVDCATPMTRDRTATGAAYDRIASQIAQLLDAGKSVAFITLGDASVYSTWSYLAERMGKLGYAYEVLPGITSFSAAAARLGEPLCEGPEQLLVVPIAAGDPQAALDVPGTKVFMKAGRHLGDLQRLLRERGLASGSKLVANCTLPGEVVIRDLDATDDLPGYMSVVISKEPPPPSAPEVSDPPRKHEAFDDLVARIGAPDEQARATAIDKWNAVAKPIGSLGVLEDDIVRIAALTGKPDVSLAKRACVVFCADNGVVAQGVSQCGQDVTRAVALNIAKGASSVCTMARTANVDVIGVDIGMADPALLPSFENDMAWESGMPLMPDPQPIEGFVNRPVGPGTGDISMGPAMTREQALRAIGIGADLARELKERGYRIIAGGEMGIGNTTTASAMASVLLGMSPADATGRGAGLDDGGLARKVAAIERAIAVNAPDADDALDVLAKLGGFDIAGLAGLFIGGARYRIPVVIDGFIGSLAALVAKRLCPACTCAMIASHLSAEPAARAVMDELGLDVPMQAGLRLGEGTGAVCLIPMLDMALALYNGTSFAETGIDAYDPDLAAECDKGTGHLSHSSIRKGDK